MELIKVLHIVSKFGSGGIETMLFNLYKEIDKNKIQFDFFVHDDDMGFYGERFSELGCKIYMIKKPSISTYLEYRNEVKRFLLKNYKEYKIIHAHMRTTAHVYAIEAKKYGVVTITHSHSTSSGKGLSAVVKRVVQLPLRYYSDYLMACSYQSGEWLFGKEFKKRGFVIKNSISIKEFSFDIEVRNEKRKSLQIENKFVIGHVGNFNGIKNQEFLIELMKEICKSNKDTILLLIGGGDDLIRSNVEKKILEYGLYERCSILGIREDVSQLLQAMDVFVFPSYYEGVAVALVEAQAAGLHCIVSDTISKDVFLTDLIEPLSLDEPINVWTEKIMRYSDGYIRQDTYEKLKNSGYDVAQSSGWLESFYESIYQKTTFD